MATVEYWIQLENRPWDACPNNIDRMHGAAVTDEHGVAPVTVGLYSPETNNLAKRTMYLPTNEGVTVNPHGPDTWKVIDALILRRYTANWTVPDDRRVNPWDLNEPDPTDAGTMGTIPGPTLECSLGDRMVVHFRNKDFRPDHNPRQRAHSLHPHGIVFAPQYDGAFPLSPPDRAQPIPPAEAAAWAAVGVTGFKMSDRVPAGGSFTYVWDTMGWPTTSGVWHYHDHSFCDAENVMLGMVGFLIIHNPDDPDDVIQQDLPRGVPNGKLVRRQCVELGEGRLLPEHVRGVRVVERDDEAPNEVTIRDDVLHPSSLAAIQEIIDESPLEPGHVLEELPDPDPEVEPRFETLHRRARLGIEREDVLIEFDPISLEVPRVCFNYYINPPRHAQYLIYFHELPGVHMAINGRRFLGNTPTVLGGTRTRMRFGVAAMNNLTFHTFHLHGHRWVMPGPAGSGAAIHDSPQVAAASQFEDTKILGPANSFGFTINQGSRFGSRNPAEPARAPGVGEWHMHCHVLNHMMPGGMMGSLLVIQGGELALPLPVGDSCHDMGHGQPPPGVVVVDGMAFAPATLAVTSGSDVTFEFHEANHSVTTTSVSGAASAIELNGGGGPTTPVPAHAQRMVTVTGNPGDEIHYICGIHGAMMSGTIQIV